MYHCLPNVIVTKNCWRAGEAQMESGHTFLFLTLPLEVKGDKDISLFDHLAIKDQNKNSWPFYPLGILSHNAHHPR